MIKTKLPILEKHLDGENNVVKNEKEIEIVIDTSIYAEERWEANFPHSAKNETLFAYISRVQNNKTLLDKAHILTNLKALYCFIEGDAITNFKTFCQMFDFSDSGHIKKLTDKMTTVFNAVLGASVTDPKNS